VPGLGYQAGEACGSRFFSSATRRPNAGEKGSRGGGDSSASLLTLTPFGAVAAASDALKKKS